MIETLHLPQKYSKTTLLHKKLDYSTQNREKRQENVNFHQKMATRGAKSWKNTKNMIETLHLLQKYSKRTLLQKKLDCSPENVEKLA